MSGRPSESAITQNVPPEIAQTPAARPSSPSRKLTMFMIATIQSDRQRDPDPLRQRVHAEDREREAVHPDPEAGRDRGGGDLAAELLPPDEAAEVVDRADRRRDGHPEQQALRLAPERQEGERRHEDPEEEREPAEPRHRAAVHAARAGPVDDAEHPRHPADRRRQQHDDHERQHRPVDDLGMVGERLPDHVYFVP